jgi:hypothetical protein
MNAKPSVSLAALGRAVGILSGLLLALSATIARGQEATQGELIGFTSLVSLNRAPKYLARAIKEKEVLAKFLTFAPGYPKVLTEADFSELREGEQIVALGICPVAEDKSQRALLEAFYPDAIVREIRRPLSRFSCPSLVGGWEVKGSGTVNAESMKLSGALLAHKSAGSKGGEELLLALYLRRSRAELADSKEIAFPAGCTATISEETLSKDNEAIRLEKTCSGTAGPAREILRFAVVDGRIAPAPGLGQTQDVRAVVWDLADTDEGAKAALARWEREKAALPKELLELPAGYPKVAKSDEYPGLPAGKRVVLIGVCPADRVAGPMDVLTALQAKVTAEKVTLSKGEPECPKVGRAMSVAQVERARVGTYELTVMWAENQDEKMLVAYLRDATGALVDRRDEGTITFTQVKKLSVFKKKEAGRDEVKGIQASMTWSMSEEGELTLQDRTITYTVSDGKIVAAEKMGPKRKRWE